MKAGDELNYYGKKVIVLETNSTHVLVEFENGTKICTPKLTFANGEKRT